MRPLEPQPFSDTAGFIYTDSDKSTWKDYADIPANATTLVLRDEWKSPFGPVGIKVGFQNEAYALVSVAIVLKECWCWHAVYRQV